MELIGQIRQHASRSPRRIALEGSAGEISYGELAGMVESLARQLRQRRVHTLALALDNGPAWVALDLAALHAGLCLIPLPPFFSTAQVRHALAVSGAQALITDQAGRLGSCLDLPTPGEPLDVAGQAVDWIDLADSDRCIPGEVCKITFTSGTTGEPKGVMLGWQHMQPVVRSLSDAVEVTARDRHLVLTPLAVLLENIAGVYVSLWNGATVIVPGNAEVGLAGSSGLDAPTMTAALHRHRASTAIFSPHTLQGMIETIESGQPAPSCLRFGAVGGAPVSPRLLQRADRLGLPIFEGYGLSECASVVCLNSVRHKRPGTVGRPLPHVQIHLTGAGEIHVEGAGFAGYLGETAKPTQSWASGDIGRLGEDGFLSLLGRQRDIFITAFGRNVSPAWVEHELTLEPAIRQAAVFGEAMPCNVAVVHPAAGATSATLAGAFRKVNARLPDYARISGWITTADPFTPSNGLLTGTGRIRREAVQRRHRQQIEDFYQKEHAS